MFLAWNYGYDDKICLTSSNKFQFVIYGLQIEKQKAVFRTSIARERLESFMTFERLEGLRFTFCNLFWRGRNSCSGVDDPISSWFSLAMSGLCGPGLRRLNGLSPSSIKRAFSAVLEWVLFTCICRDQRRISPVWVRTQGTEWNTICNLFFLVSKRVLNISLWYLSVFCNKSDRKFPFRR